MAAYVAGMGIETVSENQRAAFKKDPKNAGKPITSGLWSVARHINYTGYSLWRAGFTCAAAGFPACIFVLGMLLADFNYRAIPVLDNYCSDKVSPVSKRLVYLRANVSAVRRAMDSIQGEDAVSTDSRSILIMQWKG